MSNAFADAIRKVPVALKLARTSRYAARNAWGAVIHSGPGLRYFTRGMPNPVRVGSIPHNDPPVIQTIRDGFVDAGFEVCAVRIDPADYRDFVIRAAYPESYSRLEQFPEKALEHYLASRLLDLSPGEVYVDIANAGSPVPEIVQRLYGCTVYRQDLMYPPGLNGNVIGGDAGDLHLPDDFADKLALHCSFEHFEEDSDSRFIREAARILRPGGRLCILPLWMFSEHAVQTDPTAWSGQRPHFNPDAVLYFARGYGLRHGRFYDVDRFVGRVAANLNGLNLSILTLDNAHEVDPICDLRFIALFEKPLTPDPLSHAPAAATP